MSLETDISDAVARVYGEEFGCGPEQAETVIAADVVTTVLGRILTRAEREMVSRGRGDAILARRSQWLDATRPAFCAAVEGLTGRRCRGVVGGVDVRADTAVEVFVLDQRS